MSELLGTARELILAGYWVVPVSLTLGEDGKKRPWFPSDRWESTNDVAELENAFASVDGIAVDTERSGIVVLDLDVSGEKDGLRNLKDAGIALPRTPMTVTTWSGGFHGFFRQPVPPVGSSQNKPVKNVDVRGLGGLAFTAPSIVVRDGMPENAGEYRFNAGITPVASLPVLPEYFASRLRAKPAETKREPATRFNTQVREDQAAVLGRYLEEDLSVIRGMVDGERNELLGRTTLLLADRCRKLGYTYTAYRALVVAAYEESGGTDDTQVTNWCRSSWDKAKREPLGMPRTRIDEMADETHARLLADRLARARLTGATSRMVTPSSFVDWTVAPPEPQFWVDGVLPYGEQVVFYGAPEAGKTFMSLEWGLSVATGRRSFGRSVTPGTVWFMAGEGQTRITSRVHAWVEHTGDKPDPARFKLLNHVPDLMNDQVIDQLARKAAEDEVDLIFLDTLGRAMSIGGGDPGAPVDMAQALRGLQGIGRYRPQLTPVVIHHPTKDGGMAGAYNLLAGVDVALHAEVDDLSVGTVRFRKNKDGEKTTVSRYRWRAIGRSAVLVPADQYEAIDPDDLRRRMEEGL